MHLPLLGLLSYLVVASAPDVVPWALVAASPGATLLRFGLLVVLVRATADVRLRARRKGLACTVGVPLALAGTRADALGGRLTAESAPGRGRGCTLLLPPSALTA